MKYRKTLWRLLAVLFAFTLIAAACGNDSDDDGGDAATDTAGDDGDTGGDDDDTGGDDGDTGGDDRHRGDTGGDTDGDTDGDTGGDDEMTDDGDMDPTAGCGDDAATDPSDMTPGRTVARCEPGYPMAQPLAERQTVKLANRFRAEFVAPILLAEHYGLFDEENIDVEWVELSLTDSMVPLDDCEVDFSVGGTEASFHNGIATGLDVKMVLGNYFPPDAGDLEVPQTGFWVRRDVFSDPENPDLAELSGRSVASAVGLGSVIIYPMAQAFADAGLSLLDLEFQQIPSPEQIIALDNNAVQGSWLLDPYWVEASERPDEYVLLASQTPGEPLGGLYAGPCVREGGDRHEAGMAFVRAYIRAVNTYLPLEYQDDAEVMAALEEETGQPAADLIATPPLYFDWEVRETTSQNAQQFFIEFETVEYDEVLTDDQVVDRSMYLKAVGAE